MRDVLIGQTDYTVLVKIVSTTGAPVTGLAHTDIDIAYSRVETDNDVTTSDVTPADLANLTAAHSDWGWEEVSSTDHPGLYRLDIADAVFASGAWEAVVTITDASGTDFYATEIGFRLVNIDPQASNLPANVTQWNGTNVASPATAGYPAVTIKTGTGTGEVSLSSGAVIVQSGTGTGQVSLSSGAVTVGTNNDKTGYRLSATGVDDVWDEDATGHQTQGTFGQAIGDPGSNSNTIWGMADGISTTVSATFSAVVTIDGIVDAILVDTAEIGAAGAGLTDLGGMSTTMKGQVESEVSDGLIAKGLDHLISASVTGTDIADNSIIAKLASKSATADWDTYVNTTDSLEAARDNIGTGGSVIADSVWDEATSGHVSAGTFGASDAQAILSLNTIESGISDLQTQIGTAGDGLTAITNALTTIDDFLDTEVAAILAAVDTEVAAIKAKTDNLPSDPADQSAVEAAILAAWTTTITESYRSAGAAGTPAQLLHELIAHHGDAAISGTTKTIKNRAGTAAKTYTLDSASAPTAVAEAT